MEGIIISVYEVLNDALKVCSKDSYSKKVANRPNATMAYFIYFNPVFL